MRLLTTLVVFANAFLLFMAEPMMAKLMLPRFGGSAAVWTTALLFFQTALLLGYIGSHFFAKRTPKLHPWVHAVALIACIAILPLDLRGPTDPTAHPIPFVLLTLALTIGFPFLVLSAGSSAFQSWFAQLPDPQAKDPYFLYAASNIGSLAALVAYPILVEPNFSLGQQLRTWRLAYIGLAVLVLILAAVVAQKAKPDAESEEENGPLSPISTRQKALWVALAAAPSSLMIGVTTYLTLNVAPVPLLWVVPLGLYLGTFIIAFSHKRYVKADGFGQFVGILAAPLAVALVLESSQPLIPLAVFHLGTFFMVALSCHARLADSRPDRRHLTEFYLWIAVGGALGGLFNAVIAPYLFTTVLEYPIALAVGCMLVITRVPLKLPKILSSDYLVGTSRTADFTWGGILFVLTAALTLGTNAIGMQPGTFHTFIAIGFPALAAFYASDRPRRFGLALLGLFLATTFFHTAAEGKEIYAARSFYSVSRILDVKGDKPGDPTLRKLVDGTTTHGEESLAPGGKDVPLTYYTESGPVGSIFAAFAGNNINASGLPPELLKKFRRREAMLPVPSQVGLVGLGVGSIAAYGRPGQTFTYFEIDPVVRRIAEDPKLFTFLSDSKAKIVVVPGDGRLELAKQPNDKFGLLMLDAFSSDSIPVHLLTEDAIKMYLQKLTPHGFLAFHVSNRFLRLAPVLAAEAQALGLYCVYDDDEFVTDQQLTAGKSASQWVIISRDANDLGPIDHDSDWQKVFTANAYGGPSELPRPWTDRFSNLFTAFKWDF